MSGQRLAAFGCGDEDSGKLQEQFQSWAQRILEAQTEQTDAAAVIEPIEPIIEQVGDNGFSSAKIVCIWHMLCAVMQVSGLHFGIITDSQL